MFYSFRTKHLKKTKTYLFLLFFRGLFEQINMKYRALPFVFFSIVSALTYIGYFFKVFKCVDIKNVVIYDYDSEENSQRALYNTKFAGKEYKLSCVIPYINLDDDVQFEKPFESEVYLSNDKGFCYPITKGECKTAGSGAFKFILSMLCLIGSFSFLTSFDDINVNDTKKNIEKKDVDV